MFCGDLNLIACYIHPSPLSSLHSPETYLPAFCIISISKANKESGKTEDVRRILYYVVLIYW